MGLGIGGDGNAAGGLTIQAASRQFMSPS